MDNQKIINSNWVEWKLWKCNWESFLEETQNNLSLILSVELELEQDRAGNNLAALGNKINQTGSGIGLKS